MSDTKTFMPGNKFIRRSDLTPSIRLFIAFTALTAKTIGKWGQITELSRQFMISRMFVYMLANTLQEKSSYIFGETVSQPVVSCDLPYRYILSLRLEGRCSIEAIATIMKRFDVPNGSVGSISQLLKRFGSILPNTLVTANDEIRLVVFLSDEVFAQNRPILVTVDPISSAILKIELADSRKVDDWKNHWECIQKNGHIATYLVTDEGRGLCGAHKQALADIIRQPDTYHAIAHRLGVWSNILERVAFKTIEKEYNCWNTLDSARSEAVINGRIEAYEKAKKKLMRQLNSMRLLRFFMQISSGNWTCLTATVTYGIEKVQKRILKQAYL